MRSRITAAKLIDMITETPYDARSYSGRYMYGKQCVAVEVPRDGNHYELLAGMTAAAQYVLDDPDEWLDLMRETKTDSLGLGMIVYWPGVEWDSRFDEEEDDEDVFGDPDAPTVGPA